jgi:NAD(P)-dependent dehydrogenase (short-subunit alcohol dehydrogenase family)
MARATFDFSDDVVIVTGGSSGIGRATALAFGDAGATVVVADVREEPKDIDAETPTHERIVDDGGDAAYVETDVSDPDAVESVVEAAREYGGVDVMVNNAGVFVGGSVTDRDGDALDADGLDTMYGVNVRGVFVGTKVAAQDMLDRDDSGAIVNTASISSSYAQHGQIGYDATKGAVRMLTRGAALELGGTGIRVNAVAPGQIATEFIDGWTEDAKESGETGEGFLKDIPMERAGTPADVAPAVCYLASDAAGYTTGELLHVDGGWQVC